MDQMKRLIVNADDFGYTRGVNSGVIRGFRDGIITSTTIMANGAAFEDAVERAKQNPKLGVGVHLVLVGERSVEAASAIPSLVDGKGRLPANLGGLTRKLLTGAVRGEDIAREVRAQIKRVICAGIEPTHVDSHKHTHSHPRVMEQVVRVADEFGIRRVRKPFEDAGVLLWSGFDGGWNSLKRRMTGLAARTAAPQFQKMVREHGMFAPNHFWGVAATGQLHREALLSVIASLPDGVNEVMCHPGEYDEELEHSQTRLKKERQQELDALTDPAVRRAINQQQIELMDYRGLN
jgi:chitin disaccharide deacetylase